MSGLAHQFWLLFNQRAQLIKRVERQELNAAATIDLTFTQLFHCHGHDAVGSTIAIGHRQANALPVFIQQDVVHAPGVDADAVYQNAFIAHLVEADADFGFQRVDIPGIKTFLLMQAVHETVDFAQ